MVVKIKPLLDQIGHQYIKPALLLSLIGLILPTNALAIVKWVDEKGVTHYGDRVPPQYVDQKSSVLNKQGVTLQTRDPKTEQQAVIKRENDKVAQEQQRRDSVLLSIYTSEKEIEIARDRNLEIDNFTLAALREAEETTMAQKVKTLSQMNKLSLSKKPIPAKLKTDLKAQNAKLLDTRNNIKKMIAQMDEKRAQYNADILRYTELKPRIASLGDIRKKEAALAELKTWRAKVEQREKTLQADLTEKKRRGQDTSGSGSVDLQNAQAEIARANQEIKAMEQTISNMRTQLATGNTTAKP